MVADADEWTLVLSVGSKPTALGHDLSVDKSKQGKQSTSDQKINTTSHLASESCSDWRSSTRPRTAQSPDLVNTITKETRSADLTPSHTVVAPEPVGKAPGVEPRSAMNHEDDQGNLLFTTYLLCLYTCDLPNEFISIHVMYV